MTKKHIKFIWIFILLIVGFLIFFYYYNSPDTDLPVLVDAPWERNSGFLGVDRLRYVLSSIIGRYEGYPWAVRISYGVVVISCIAVLLLSCLMVYDVLRRRYSIARFNWLQQHYGKGLRQIAATSERKMSMEEIERVLNIDSMREWSYADKLLWIDLFTIVRMEVKMQGEGLPNLQRAIHLLNLTEFMETRLAQGRDRDKLRIIQGVRLLEMEMPDSAMARLVNHRRGALRKAARFYYMLINRDDPYRFFA